MLSPDVFEVSNVLVLHVFHFLVFLSLALNFNRLLARRIPKEVGPRKSRILHPLGIRNVTG